MAKSKHVRSFTKNESSATSATSHMRHGTSALAHDIAICRAHLSVSRRSKSSPTQTATPDPQVLL